MPESFLSYFMQNTLIRLRFVIISAIFVELNTKKLSKMRKNFLDILISFGYIDIVL